MPEIPGRDEQILKSILDGTEYSTPPQSRIESLLLQLKDAIESGGGGGTGITVDDHIDQSSKNPVQNKVIAQSLAALEGYMVPISEDEYEAILVKDKPIYFIYD